MARLFALFIASLLVFQNTVLPACSQSSLYGSASRHGSCSCCAVGNDNHADSASKCPGCAGESSCNKKQSPVSESTVPFTVDNLKRFPVPLEPGFFTPRICGADFSTYQKCIPVGDSPGVALNSSYSFYPRI